MPIQPQNLTVSLVLYKTSQSFSPFYNALIKIMPPPYSSHHPPSAADDDGDAIVALHSDILQTHILTRLDGAALTSAASASSRFRRLSREDLLWRRVCSTSWPSTTHPRVQQAISAFPSEHRSFFSDVFPVLDCRSLRCDLNRSSSSSTSELISAVDIHYKDKLLFSKVDSIETKTNWFLGSPFRVDLIDPKDSIPSPIRRTEKYEDWLGHLEENLTVSWIVIDPIKNRAANVSSRQAVKARWQWLSGDIEVEYTTVMGGDGRIGSAEEMVECAVVVSCGEKEEEEGMEMSVREVSMRMLDMEGKHLKGKESMEILGEAMERGKRIRGKKWEGKLRFREYEERRRLRKARKERTENALDMLCIFTGIAILFSFCSFFLFLFLST
ncbi:probable F-box protein At2g36090 [Cucurbita moschata]|uniref:Probable F-box protein At2g36090 n=1 Tax=Cucurbita moschata TaxID=3662 RepID=A0A6J1FUW4_CUCMO|nr:probable F-box protein At2g36090 [Cucurbita moschata]